jgi:outer membrane protein assembly factor BamB
VLAIAPAPAAGASTPGQLLFRIADPRITEASGIAPGLASPGIVYVHNDSGDTNRFFALDARTGATVATVQVTGTSNQDWEDIAVARDAAGTPSVWLADIGDNDAVRPEIRVYRADEPTLRPRPAVAQSAPRARTSGGCGIRAGR